MEKTIQQLEEDLEMMRSFHRGAWETYGSELSTSEMLAQETKLENEIFKLKQREETVKRWEKSGLLEGLTGSVKDNVAQLHENQQKIKEDPSQIIDN